MALPPIEAGQPVFQGWRMMLQYRAGLNVGVGDDVFLEGIVPRDEYWRVRAFWCADSTAAGGGGPNGWEEQQFNSTPTEYAAATASVANPSPTNPFVLAARNPTEWRWRRAWDGKTELVWRDANNARLIVRDCDPTFGPTILLPGQEWEIVSLGAEEATGLESTWWLFMLVDRFLEPSGSLERRVKSNDETMLKMLNLAAHVPLAGVDG